MLQDLDPRPVFQFFEELTKIPRCSGDERRVSDYLVEFAQQRELEAFQDEALNVIAKKAIERRTGARGLRSIMEGILLDTMFDLPGLDGVEQVVIGPEVIEGKQRPLYIYTERAENKAG